MLDSYLFDYLHDLWSLRIVSYYWPTLTVVDLVILTDIESIFTSSSFVFDIVVDSDYSFSMCSIVLECYSDPHFIFRCWCKTATSIH